MSYIFKPDYIWTNRSEYIEAEDKLLQANKSAVKGGGKGKRKGGTAQNEKKVKSGNDENKNEKIIEKENQTEENEPSSTGPKTRSKKHVSKSKSPMPDKAMKKTESENTSCTKKEVKLETKLKTDQDENKIIDEIDKKFVKKEIKPTKINEDFTETENKTDIGQETKPTGKSETTKIENSQASKKSKKGKGQQQNEPKTQDNKKSKKEKPLEVKKESEKDIKMIEDKNINEIEMKAENKENDKMNVANKKHKNKMNESKSTNECKAEMENLKENKIQGGVLKVSEQTKTCEKKGNKCNEKSSKLETKGGLSEEIMRVRKLIINSLEHEKKLDGSQLVDKEEDYDIKKRLMELSSDFIRLERRVSLLEEFFKLQTEYMPSKKIDD